MRRQREEGACFAYSKHDASSFALQRGEYPRLLSDWKAGKAFFTGIAFYGSEITLKLSDISAVVDTTAESMRLGREDSAADKMEDAIND